MWMLQQEEARQAARESDAAGRAASNAQQRAAEVDGQLARVRAAPSEAAAQRRAQAAAQRRAQAIAQRRAQAIAQRRAQAAAQRRDDLDE